MSAPRVILASASPRRKELLGYLCLSFSVIAPQVDEQQLPGEKPVDLVRRLAKLKAQSVQRENSAALVIAADTIVVVDDRVLNKPSDKADAAAMLQSLSGREHLVITGVFVSAAAKNFERLRDVQTVVSFRALNTEEIENYISTPEPFDKAGAYAAQGTASGFIKEVRGSYTNVIGLPLAELAEDLKLSGYWNSFPQPEKD